MQPNGAQQEAEIGLRLCCILTFNYILLSIIYKGAHSRYKYEISDVCQKKIMDYKHYQNESKISFG